MYLEVFSFKLCAAWSDRLENYISGAQKHNKHNLHVYILYINVIISYSFQKKKNFDGWWAPSLSVITKVSSIAAAIGWTIPCDFMEIAEQIVRRYSNRYNHSMEFESILFHVLHNIDASMLCKLFDDRKYMYIYLSIHQEYGYLGKDKINLYFRASTCEHLWHSHSHTTWF